MKVGQLAENRLAVRGNPHQYPAPIGGVNLAHDQSLLVEAINQADGAVMTDVEAIGEGADGWRSASRQPLQGQQQLVLLRVQPVGTSGAFAERQEPADLVTELGERLVIRIARAAHLLNIVTRYKLRAGPLSRSGLVARLPGMKQYHPSRGWVVAITLLHLAVCIAHGMAHDSGHVPMSQAGNLFVFVVILAGPLVGLALLWRIQQVGSWIVAGTLAAAFAFGVVNHFVLDSPDHVRAIAQQVRPAFTATALLLALTEAAGATLALRLARETPVRP